MERINLGFSTAALFPRETEQALRLIRTCGFEFAEIMPQCRKETKPRYARELLRKSLGIRICSVHFPLIYFPVFYNPYPGMRSEARKLIDDLVEMGSLMEAKVIVIHPPKEAEGVKGELFHRSALENIRYLCDRAGEFDIVIAIENSPESICKDPEGMISFLKETARTNAYPMVDTTEAMKAGVNPIRFLKLDPIHFHLSDYSKGKMHLPPGEGSVPWREFLKLLPRSCPGCLILEPAYSHLISESEAGKKMEKMKEFMERLWDERSG